MATIIVEDSYTLDAGQALDFDNEDAFHLTGGTDGRGKSSVTIAGTVAITADSSVHTVRGFYEADATSSEVSIESGGVMDISATGIKTSALAGVFIDPTRFTNAGTISVQGEHNTGGVYFEADFHFTNAGWLRVDTTGAYASGVTGRFGSGFITNTGVITVSAHGNALGLDFEGSLHNSGEIKVVGGDAQAVTITGSFDNSGAIAAHATADAAHGVIFNSTGGSFGNEGSILAKGDDGSVAVTISVSEDATWIFQNSGLISGSAGFLLISPDSGYAQVALDNSGRILGDVTLGNGQDILDNTGRIVGDIDLQNGNDVYDAHDKGKLAGALYGGGGSDDLSGGMTSDVLFGDDQSGSFAGNDRLAGGGGADTLTGGLGADVFVYLTLADSRGAKVDLITDLGADDQIDLSHIDADAVTAGNQAFHLVAKLDGHAREAALVYDAARDTTRLVLDVDGDGKADALIRIAGDHHDFTNFVL